MPTTRLNALVAITILSMAMPHWSCVRAQGKDTKKEVAQPTPQEALLKSFDENRVAIEKLNSRLANVEASGNTQHADVKEVLKAVDGLKAEIAKSQGSFSSQQSEIKEVLRTAQDTKHLIESLPKPSIWKDLSGSITGGLFALIVATVSIFYNRKIAKDNQDANMVIARENQKANKELSDNNLASARTIAQQNIEMARRTLQEKAKEEERKRITQKIDEFCGPFLTLREQSKHLYFGFFLPLRSKKELEEYKDKKEGKYRTVIALLRGFKFQGVDAWFLTQIVEIGKQCADLIELKTGMIEDAELREILAKTKTHYRIIADLFEKPDDRIILTDGDDDGSKNTKLEMHDKIEADAIFPRIVTEAVEKMQAGLKQRLKELSEN